MIYSNKKVYFLDFGLGFNSARFEDKAVDLHVLKEALEARHPAIYKKVFTSVIKVYKASHHSREVLKRLERVERRGRYRHQD